MISENLTFPHEGAAFEAALMRPDGPRRPVGVLVLHGGHGLDAHTLGQTERLARAGHVAMAPDLFGGPFRDRAHGMQVIGGLIGEPLRLRARCAAALAVLQTKVSKVAVVGYCFGGLAALEMARGGSALHCAVSLHGGLQALIPDETSPIVTPLLFCVGADDPFAPAAARTTLEDELRRRGADWTMLVLGGAQHGFTEVTATPAAGIAYNRPADQRSWRALLGMLDEDV